MGWELKDKLTNIRNALLSGYPPLGVYNAPIFRIRYTRCEVIHRDGSSPGGVLSGPMETETEGIPLVWVPYSALLASGCRGGF